MGIGERLRAMRKKRGMTLTELGKRSKVSKSYLSQLENGQFSNPSTEIVTRLCGALGISGGAILGLEEMPSMVPRGRSVSSQLRTLAREERLSDEEIDMLSRIRYQNKQPTSVEGWRAVLKAIQRSTSVE